MGCELIKIKACDFQEIGRACCRSVGFLVKYAETFVQHFNDASQAITESTDDLLFNTPEVADVLVFEALQACPRSLQQQVYKHNAFVPPVPGRKTFMPDVRKFVSVYPTIEE